MNEWDESGGPYRMWSANGDNTAEIMIRMRQKESDKMSEEKKLGELFPDGKGDGRKFIFKVGASDSGFWFIPYFRTVERAWHGINEFGLSFIANEETKVKEYIEKKETKRITMYRPICKSFSDNKYWSSLPFRDSKEDFLVSDDIVGWIEVVGVVEK